MAASLEAYFRGRTTLERAYVLIDARVGVKIMIEKVMKLLKKQPCLTN